MKIKILISSITIACLLLGCAGTKVTTIDSKGNVTKGFIVYQTSPYLWVCSDSAAKSLVYKIIYLPDKSKAIHIVPKRGFGSATTSFKLSDGCQLTEFGATSDSKIPETITAIGALTTAFMSSVKSEDTNATKKDIRKEINSLVGIYPIIFDSVGVIKIGVKISGYPSKN
ncbi:MAG: hypothetical protein WCQ95_10670 [Bacteroidota bacterium]